MKTAYIITAAIALLVTIFEIARNSSAHKKILGEGLLVTNSNILRELKYGVALIILTPRYLLIKDTFEGVPINIRLVIAIGINVLIIIYALSTTNYFERQYILDGSYIYKKNNEKDKMPYSAIDAMYEKSRNFGDEEEGEPDVLWTYMYIKRKKYTVILTEDEYNNVKEKVNLVVRKNAEYIYTEITAPKKQWGLIGKFLVFMVLIMAVVIYINKYMNIDATVEKMVRGGLVALIPIALISILLTENAKKWKIVKKTFDGEIAR